jgi:hypothetical protein
MTEDDPLEVITVSGRQTVHIHNLIPARGWWAVFEVDGSYSNTDRVVLWAVVDRGRGYEEVHGLVSAGKEGLVLAEEARWTPDGEAQMTFMSYVRADSFDDAVTTFLERRLEEALASTARYAQRPLPAPHPFFDRSRAAAPESGGP